MTDVALLMFWVAAAGIFYPYAGYPMILILLGKVVHRAPLRKLTELPTVSMIVPVHNEAARLAVKIANTRALDYPVDRLQVLYVSDGSTDDTATIVRNNESSSIQLVELSSRGGKARALNAGLQRASGEIVVFSDAAILLERSSLRAIVAPFADPAVGCVSGEDHIADGGTEGLYGRYELLLRRLESDVHSIVGASGSFYAQRRELCAPFIEGMAPDFLSVLRTVQRGYRAVSWPSARGQMTSVKDPRQEFDRKVRTLLRGMTALFEYKALLNPVRYGFFAFALWSHKVLRWTVPVFLIIALISPLWLLERPLFRVILFAEVVAYLTAWLALRGWGGIQHTRLGRIALYFASVNAAILAAWYLYWTGVRQELWTPTRR